MNPKKLLALALALVLALISTGVIAYAQSAADEATPAEITENTPAPDGGNEEPASENGTGEDDAGETEISNVIIPGEGVEPAGEDKTPEQPVEPEQGVEENGASDTEPEAEPTQEPAAEQPTSPLPPEGEPETEPTETPTAEQPTSSLPPEGEPEIEPTETPAAEPTDVPEIPEIYVSPYAKVSSGTSLYKDMGRNEKLGELIGDTVMLVHEVSAYEQGSLYEAYFVTDESLQADACEHAYFFASSLELLDKEQTEVCLNSVGIRKVDGKPVFMADILYEEPIIEETEEPKQPEGDLSQSHVNKSDVNMRSEPSQHSDRIAKLQNGENVEVIARVVNANGEAWYAVIYQGSEGFIRADLVNAIGDIPEMRYEGDTLIPDAEPTDEPEVVLPEETEQPIAKDMPILYTVKYFDANGNLLTAYEVEGGKTFEEEVFLFEEGTFLGWYPCDENGTYTGITPYDFSQRVESPVYIRARVREDAEVVPDATAENTTPKSVIVTTSYDTETLQLGSQITLTAMLTGYEGLNYTCYWQYAAASSDGSIIGEWQNAQSGDLSFTYVLTEKNLLTAWRMCVTVNE